MVVVGYFVWLSFSCVLLKQAAVGRYILDFAVCVWLLVTGAAKSTLTAAMKTMLNLPPLDIYTKGGGKNRGT